MKIQIKRIDPRAIIPTYATDCSAGFDLYAVHDAVIEPGQQGAIRTGLCISPEPGWMVKLFSRSGHGYRNGVTLANSVGIIDCDYREELVVLLRNNGTAPFHVKAGNRIAQGLLERYQQAEFVEVGTLDTTNRNGGFGSTGQ